MIPLPFRRRGLDFAEKEAARAAGTGGAVYEQQNLNGRAELGSLSAARVGVLRSWPGACLPCLPQQDPTCWELPYLEPGTTRSPYLFSSAQGDLISIGISGIFGWSP